jgi:uncharacterized protein YbjT (DUF2867 family)
MSVSAAYLEATVNVAAVARHHGVEAFVNMSQMTVTQMSVTETTGSPQHKLHWLAERALAWSGLPVVTVRPTVFLEGFFLRLAAAGVRDRDELALPLGDGKTSPVSAVDVARAVSVVLDDPAPHIGRVYNLTGFESADLAHHARVFSEALGRTIRYRDVPLSEWTDGLRGLGLPAHVVDHLAVMAELHAQGRYDRMTEDLSKLTGGTPTSMYDFVKAHAADLRGRPLVVRGLGWAGLVWGGPAEHALPVVRSARAAHTASHPSISSRACSSASRRHGPRRRRCKA